MKSSTLKRLTSVLFLGLAAPALAQASGWSGGPNMSVARYAASAAVLPDGRVLVAGGYNSFNGALSSAQLFNGATNTWTTTGSMKVTRDFFTSTVLQNGKVLIAGGWNGTGSLNQADLYDPAAGTFTALPLMNVYRELFTATLLPDGKVLLAGGFTTFNRPGGGTQATAEVFDPATGLFTAVGSMQEARFGHDAILLPDETGSTASSRYVLIVGGKLRLGTGEEWARNTAELYDIESGQFVRTFTMRHRRDRPTAGWIADRDAEGRMLATGRVLVVGGQHKEPTLTYNPKECEWFDAAAINNPDPAAAAFTAGPALNNGRMAHTLTPLADGGLLAANGWDQANQVCTATTERYLPLENRWELAGNTSYGSVDAVAAPLPDGRVFVAGGVIGSTYLRRTDLYRPPAAPVPGNEPPATAADSYTTAEDTPLTVAAPGVLENDTDPNGDALSAALASGPANGTVSLNANGSFTYTPKANFHGTDSFSYVASDGKGGSAAASVTLTVNPVNDPPKAVSDSASTNPYVAVTIPVLVNDTDVDQDHLTVIAVTQPANGLAQISTDGTEIVYTPTTSTGSVTFSYTISDGQGGTAAAAVTVTVNKPRGKK